MPEIPDLEAIRDFFNEHLAGKTIGAVETRIPPVFRTPAKELRETLPGDRFGAVRRHVYDPDTGVAKDFVSGYSSQIVPNLWDRSAEIRAGSDKR